MSRTWQVAEVLVSLAAVAVAAAGVVVRRPPRRNSWLLLVAGLATFALGDVIALTTSTRQGLGPADVAYLAAYPLLVAAVALLAVATRLVAPGPTRAVPSLLALGVAAILATDVVYALRPPGDRADLSDPLHLGWLLGAALLAAAAIHPEARRPVTAAPDSHEALSGVRLMLLGAVVLIPPTLMGLEAARGDYDDVAVLSVGLVVLVVLVIGRVGLLVRDMAVTAARERTLRTDAAELVAAGSRHQARIRGRALASTLLPYADGATPDGVPVGTLDHETLVSLGLRGMEGRLHVRP